MAFQRVPDTAKIDLVYGYGSGPDVMSSFYIRNTALDRTGEYLETLIDAVGAWWDAEVKSLQTSAITLRTIKATDLDSQFGARAEQSQGTAGTGAGTAAPSVVSALVHYLGDPGSAPRKGTVFHPGLTEAQIGTDALDGTFAGTLQSAYDALRTTGGFAVSDALVIVSRYSGSTIVGGDETHPSRKKPTPRTVAITNTISGTVVPTRVGVQKRRRPSPL